jgi:hypothetical protein
MATLVQIVGLQRGSSVRYSAAATASGTLTESGTSQAIYPGGSEGPASVQGFRVPHAIGRQYGFDSAAKTAALTQSNVVFYANYAGSYGNNIKVSLTVTGATTSVVTTYTGGTANPTIAITVPTGAKAGDVVNAVDADPTARQFITAYAATNTAALTQFTSAINLSGGTNGSVLDAEPPYGVTGAPIYFNVTDKSIAVVDYTDRTVQRSLQRNSWRYVSLGAA